ncbi:S-layer homology domain-containing protein [Schwartzia sp. (in: firmicutes)]
MKKSLVSALTTALVVGAASTTFAAANPFEDVAADHWAYDAVAQLAADGVIEGYGDGTFRGDQEITRFEMAQMVARAMAKSGVSAADKAMIDKLAAEFADELNALGVRVAALEKKVDNVKWNGKLRYRYINTRKENKPDHTNTNQVLLRLEPSMVINNHWTGHARIDYGTDTDNMDTAKNQNNVQVERAWVSGQYGNTEINLGKLPMYSMVDDGMVFDDNIAGGQVVFGKKLKVALSVGRARFEDYKDLNADGEADAITASYQSIEVYNDRDAKFTYGVGFHHFANKQIAVGNNGENHDLNIWDLGLGYKFTDNVALKGAYAWNTAASNTEAQYRNAKRAWTVELDYKGADPAKKGSFGIFAAYRQLGMAAVWLPTYDGIERNQKGWEFGADYVFDKNIVGTVKYFTGKVMDADNTKAHRLFTELNFLF